MKRFLLALALATLAAPAALADGEKVTLVYEHAVPNVPGKSLKALLVEYTPGGTSHAHLHPSSAFVYARVLEGEVRSAVNDGPAVVYHAGESFSEMPGDRHRISENASATAPAKLLAVFVVDSNATPLTTPYQP